jgi:NAD(P)-dependent dehydrogenase (short-subunit alcohol dehydrogenase family)
MPKLQGKVAVVTGGSSGMGFATAKRFVEEGAFVYIHGRRQTELDKAVSLIGRSVAAVQGDVSNLADLDRLYAKVASEKGKIDILFAGAGIVDPQPLAEMTEESFDKVFAINTRGLAFTVKKALVIQPLTKSGRGTNNFFVPWTICSACRSRPTANAALASTLLVKSRGLHLTNCFAKKGPATCPLSACRDFLRSVILMASTDICSLALKAFPPPLDRASNSSASFSN